jgi:carbon monoxide dehydrogenase subunit G
MTVRVERTFELPVSVEEAWGFISDPAKRAEAISVVDSYEVDGGAATWHVKLPIPVVKRTAAIETRDLERREPTYVKFAGKSSVMRVVGEHELTETENGCRLTNRFVVEGRLPGVERYFKRNLDGELENLERELRAALT